MAEALHNGDDSGPRALARVAEVVHSITYYSPELIDLTSEGYRGWWHAYFGYRPAPMGEVGAGTVTAAFYNFAPRMVERAVPGVWAIKSPADAITMRAERVAAALHRLAAGKAPVDGLAAVAEPLRRALDGLPMAGRPVFAGYAELDWPDDPLSAAWHACTLLREHRGDGHNLALAGADVDGVACHVLMAASGHGNKPTILGIRGWNDDEWSAAVDRLASRGWLEADGRLTDAGRRARSAIEVRTDELGGEPARRLGPAGLEAVLDAVRPLVQHLLDTGEVPGRWPPPAVIRPD